MNNILLQASNDFGLTLFKLVIVLGICLAIFLVLRALMLWYWKIDKIVMNQEKQIEALNIIIVKLNSKIDDKHTTE